ncbi:hypothetical protein AOQ84DRAFT_363708 [Glonium stellatum]|uniref:Fucose-specific lectin n=1 Tax=Glonium stellatum TaxID=574774 RepID=A0A8E2F1V1_9PEZI|nr:hypothetical protein AOQ84DRAFT_363708 [Glonium stellatum]
MAPQLLVLTATSTSDLHTVYCLNKQNKTHEYVRRDSDSEGTPILVNGNPVTAYKNSKLTVAHFQGKTRTTVVTNTLNGGGLAAALTKGTFNYAWLYYQDKDGKLNECRYINGNLVAGGLPPKTLSEPAYIKAILWGPETQDGHEIRLFFGHNSEISLVSYSPGKEWGDAKDITRGTITRSAVTAIRSKDEEISVFWQAMDRAVHESRCQDDRALCNILTFFKRMARISSC